MKEDVIVVPEREITPGVVMGPVCVQTEPKVMTIEEHIRETLSNPKFAYERTFEGLRFTRRI